MPHASGVARQVDARSSSPAGHSLTMPARDGYPLGATVFEADGPDVAVVLAGVGILRGFYGRFAHYLAEHGVTTITFDYRGIGDSRPHRLGGFPASMTDWARLDAAGVIDWARERAEGRLLAVAHSFGGQALGLVPNAPEFDRALLVAAQTGNWRKWPVRSRPLMLTLWGGIMPAVSRALGHFPGRLMGSMQSLPKDVALQWARWSRHPQYMLKDQSREGFAALDMPMRAYSLADDRLYAPRPAVEQLLSWYSGAKIEHIHADPNEIGHPLGHFGFFRGRSRDTLWPGAVAWLRATS